MSLLSGEKKLQLAKALYSAPLHICIDTIEAAVLEAQSGQEPLPYKVGRIYDLMDGSCVRIVLEKGDCIVDEFGRHYYNRPGDRGRVTGTAHDYSFPQNLVRLYAAPVVRQPALERYNKIMEGCSEKDPIERLRFFCSLSMSGQDWLDVERFFDDLTAPVVQPGMVTISKAEHESLLDYKYRYESCSK